MSTTTSIPLLLFHFASTAGFLREENFTFTPSIETSSRVHLEKRTNTLTGCETGDDAWKLLLFAAAPIEAAFSCASGVSETFRHRPNAGVQYT
jgi:hypothetical protein